MATKLFTHDDVQYPVVASGVINFDDTLPDGTVVGSSEGTRNLDLATLPAGAIMIDGALVVTSAWFGPASGTVDVGDDDTTDVDPDRYTPTPLVINTSAAVRLMTAPAYRIVDLCSLTMEIVLTGGGAITGSFTWWFKYLVPSKAHEAIG